MTSDAHEPSSAAATKEVLGRTYDASFYEDLAEDVRESAEAVVPLVLDLVRPTSVLDVGCGRGTWLAVFHRAGIATILGVDGPHVSPDDLEIDRDAFVTHDLRTPLELDRQFDLVMSLEVGEHLDASLASDFVASLVAHAPVVLFSAAIPFQGGAGHVNEQWPSYWSALFASHGYHALDTIRSAVWRNPHVAFWYAQNTLLYIDGERRPDLIKSDGVHDVVLDLVHPSLHTRDHTTPKRTAPPPSLSRVLRDLPGAASRAVRSRTSRAHRKSD